MKAILILTAAIVILLPLQEMMPVDRILITRRASRVFSHLISNTLYEELKVRDKIGSLNDWNKMQLMFIAGHQYFTHTARKLREVNKQIQIERIRKIIT